MGYAVNGFDISGSTEYSLRCTSRRELLLSHMLYAINLKTGESVLVR